MATDALIAETDSHGVTRVVLKRPERRNALDAALVAELSKLLRELNDDVQTRVIVLTGAGDYFSSGADLQWIRDVNGHDPELNRREARDIADLLHRLYTCDKPTIGRVNGPAYGGAVGLIACCDVAIAVETTTFAFPEVRLGLVPAVIAPYVVNAMGPRTARRFFLTGEPLNAAAALQLGLVHEVAPAHRLDDAVARQVAHLLKAGPSATRECKRLLARLGGLPPQSMAELTRYTVDLLARLRASPEAREGIAAFLEKRRSKWTSSE